jgi:hypothetical protein
VRRARDAVGGDSDGDLADYEMDVLDASGECIGIYVSSV